MAELRLGVQVQVAQRLLEGSEGESHVLPPTWCACPGRGQLGADLLIERVAEVPDETPFRLARRLALDILGDEVIRSELDDFCRQVCRRIEGLGGCDFEPLQYVACYQSLPEVKAHLYVVFDPHGRIGRHFETERGFISERDDLVMKVVVTSSPIESVWAADEALQGEGERRVS